MTTFAESQFKAWDSVLDLWDGHPERLAQVSAVMVAIDQYQPVDFKQGDTWEELEHAWVTAPPSYARTQALATLATIRHAIKEYRK